MKSICAVFNEFSYISNYDWYVVHLIIYSPLNHLHTRIAEIWNRNSYCLVIALNSRLLYLDGTFSTKCLFSILVRELTVSSLPRVFLRVSLH